MFRRAAVYGAVTATATLAYGGTVMADARKPPHLLSEPEVKELLQEHELQGRDAYTRFDLSELQSLGEDGNCQGRVGEYRCWGIFDGHSGWSASNHVADHVLSYLRQAYDQQLNGSKWSLSSFFQGSTETHAELQSEEFDNVISEAFTKLDSDMLAAPLTAVKKGDAELAARAIPVAMNGACAMMAFYHPLQQLLKIALVGDSRTVLGVQDANGAWHARNLTIDQTGDNPAEIARIRAEHPKDPPSIVRNGRVLGYQPSRTFGDAGTKYTLEEQNALSQSFWTVRPNQRALTPPYLTAKPVISTVRLNPKTPSFIVMGCDGLYEWLTNEQVVDLVGQWLEKNPVIPCKPYAGAHDMSNDDSAKEFRRPHVLKWGALKPTVQDDNAATHLIRNALGGSEFKKVSLLVSLPSPMSRRHRDDITCTVIFFYPELASKL